MSKLSGAIGALQGLEKGMVGREQAKGQLAQTLMELKKYNEITLPESQQQVAESKERSRMYAAQTEGQQTQTGIAKFNLDELLEGKRILEKHLASTGEDLTKNKLLGEYNKYIAQSAADIKTAEETEKEQKALIDQGVAEELAKQKREEARFKTATYQQGTEMLEAPGALTPTELRTLKDLGIVLDVKKQLSEVELGEYEVQSVAQDMARVKEMEDLIKKKDPTGQLWDDYRLSPFYNRMAQVDLLQAQGKNAEAEAMMAEIKADMTTKFFADPKKYADYGTLVFTYLGQERLEKMRIEADKSLAEGRADAEMKQLRYVRTTQILNNVLDNYGSILTSTGVSPTTSTGVEKTKLMQDAFLQAVSYLGRDKITVKSKAGKDYTLKINNLWSDKEKDRQLAQEALDVLNLSLAVPFAGTPYAIQLVPQKIANKWSFHIVKGTPAQIVANIPKEGMPTSLEQWQSLIPKTDEQDETNLLQMFRIAKSFSELIELQEDMSAEELDAEIKRRQAEAEKARGSVAEPKTYRVPTYTPPPAQGAVTPPPSLLKSAKDFVNQGR